MSDHTGTASDEENDAIMERIALRSGRTKSDAAIVGHVYRDPQGIFWKVTNITELNRSVLAEAQDERIRNRNFYTALEWERSVMVEFDVEAFARWAGLHLIRVGGPTCTETPSGS